MTKLNNKSYTIILMLTYPLNIISHAEEGRLICTHTATHNTAFDRVYVHVIPILSILVVLLYGQRRRYYGV